MRPQARAAVEADRPIVEALIARELAAGTVLPRRFVPAEFLVLAGPSGEVLGCASFSRWGPGVVEVGTVIAAHPGGGLGRAVVEAALARVAAGGDDTAVVLTAVPGFFSRLGFTEVPDAPWARARRLPAVALGDAALTRAVSVKARKSCAACPHLAGCTQSLLVYRLPAVALPAVA
jgi:N-acetylglutamate synthase-like GNAT family acetyltransferase